MNQTEEEILDELRQITSLIRRLGGFIVGVLILFVIPACVFLLILWRDLLNFSEYMEKLVK